MNGRVYDPQLGRFLSSDPIIQAPTNLQSYNRYSYVLNNPMSYTDPSGYFSLTDLAYVAVGLPVITPVVYTGAAIVAGGVAAVAVHAPLIAHGHLIRNSSTYRAANGFVTPFLPPWAASMNAAFTTAVLGGDLTDVVVNATTAYAMSSMSGEQDLFDYLKSWASPAGFANNAYNYYVNSSISENLNRFTMEHWGITADQFNTILFGISNLGLWYNSDGDRPLTLEEQCDGIYEITGYGSRGNDPLSISFDVVDTILGYQGYLDATGLYVQNTPGVASTIYSGHSLGAIRANNLARRGVISPDVRLVSLPFGNVGSLGADIRQGYGDPISGFSLSLIFSPGAQMYNGDGFLGFGHGRDGYYSGL